MTLQLLWPYRSWAAIVAQLKKSSSEMNEFNVLPCTVVANKTGPTRVADFRAVFTAERSYLFLGPETTYAVEQ